MPVLTFKHQLSNTMKQQLSNDLLKRLKLHGYTALIDPNGEALYTITKEPVEELKRIKEKAFTQKERILLIEDLLLEDMTDEELSGMVILPSEDLASEL